MKAALVVVLELSFHPLLVRLLSADGERHESSQSWREGVVGGHRRHRCACDSGGPAAGSAAALPPQAEGKAEQHPDCLLLHQPHRQL